MANDSTLSMSSKIAESLIRGEKEFFWAIELSAENPEESVNIPPDEDDEDDSDFVSHVYFLKHAILGENAVQGERNVVQLQSKDWTGSKIKSPIFSLTAGKTEQMILDLNFGEMPATLALIHGSGPVHIVGQDCVSIPQDCDVTMDQDALVHEDDKGLVALPEEDDDEEVEDEEEEGEDEVDEDEDVKKLKAKKRKAPVKRNTKSKRGKREVAEVEEDDEEDEAEVEESMEEEEAASDDAGEGGSDEEDSDDETKEEEESPEPKKTKAASKGKGRAAKKAPAKPAPKQAKAHKRFVLVAKRRGRHVFGPTTL